MQSEPLIFVGSCDLAGIVRGKGFPAAELPARLKKGIGLTHSNIMMSAFGPIYDTPFGTEGDLMVIPDPSTRVEVEFGEGPAERFYLGDIKTTEGEYWECCPRHFLRRALAALEAEAGLGILAAFEQEFVYDGVEHRPGATYSLDAHRRQGGFGEAYMTALRAAGLSPDSFLPEYGARQYEVTVAPTRGLGPADEAVIQREMARAVAHRLGHRAIFAPILDPDGVGNGTHIHLSLWDAKGRPVLYDADRPRRLSVLGEHFVAGIVEHLPVLTAITAPSAASYIRLRPNRWAPTVGDVGVQDRGASVRICPIFTPAGEPAAEQFNIEYRVADATASPHLAFGAVIRAGTDGIRRRLTLGGEPKPLPRSLGEALANLDGSAAAREWFGDLFFDIYRQFKRSELRAVEGLDAAEICARYAEVY